MSRLESPRRRDRRRASRFHRALSAETLEARRLLASYVVNSNGTEPDGDQFDGKCDTGGPGHYTNLITLNAVLTHARYAGDTDLTITFTGPMFIQEVSEANTPASVKIDGLGRGVRVGHGLTFGRDSDVSGMIFEGALAVGPGSNVNDCKTAGIGAGSGSTIVDNTSSEGVSGQDNCTITGNTIGSQIQANKSLAVADGCTVADNAVFGQLSAVSRNQIENNVIHSGVNLFGADNVLRDSPLIGGFVSLSKSGNTIENNTIENGAITLDADFETPATNIRIVGNTLRDGQGMRINRIKNSVIENNVITGSIFEGIRLSNDNPATGDVVGGFNSITGNKIGIDAKGALAGSQSDGIRIVGSEHDTIGGAGAGAGNVVVGSNGGGIIISVSSHMLVQGNAIGTDSSGAAGLGNGRDGLLVLGAGENTIGGAAGAGNTIAAGGIAGDFVGIRVGGEKNVIQGNHIGRTRDSEPASFGWIGGAIAFDSDSGKSSDNTIGGVADGEGNVIGGNGKGLFSPRATISLIGDRNLIQGNRIGTDADGKNDLGNYGAALVILGSNNTVGGTTEKAGNIIAHNGFDDNGEGAGGGVLVVNATSLNNTIRHNSIYDNAGRGIRLADFKKSINDPGVLTDINGVKTATTLPDLDEGANHLQNYPVITKIDANSGLKVSGTLKSAENATFTLEFFANDEPHRSGFGDGQTYLDQKEVTTDGNGLATFDISLPSGASGKAISATATDSKGNTSGFSIVDSDSDGLADAWESDGIDFDEDGKIDLDLNARGANPLRKTVFVEVDRMTNEQVYIDRDTGKTSFELVEDAFKSAPVDNPDGTRGIDLIVDVGDADLKDAVLNTVVGMPKAFDDLKDAKFGTAQERADSKIIAAKKLAYHYCIMAQALSTGNSGLAELPGNDFVIVTDSPAGYLYAARTQAGTFMHELGHNLGLHHGGGGSDDFGGGDDVQYKPNLFSMMNYDWQMPGYPGLSFFDALAYVGSSVDLMNQIYNNDSFLDATLEAFKRNVRSWQLTYSTSALPALSEAFLFEPTGIGGDASITTILPPKDYMPSDPHKFSLLLPQFVPMGGAVDWNNNGNSGDLLPVQRNVNDLDLAGGSASELFQGHEDWSELWLNFLDTGDGYSDGVHVNVESNDLPADPTSTPASATVDLAVGTSLAPTLAVVGRSLSFTVVVRNNGPADASNVAVLDTLPTNAILNSVSVSQGTFSIDSGKLSVQLGALASSAVATITISLTPLAAGVVRNEAAVAGSGSDPITANNRSVAEAASFEPAIAATKVAIQTKRIDKKRQRVLVITVDGALNAAAARKLKNYRLAAAGRDKKFDTKDDGVVRLKSVKYDPVKHTLTITSRAPWSSNQTLRFRIKTARLFDATGRNFDGDGDGLPGGDLVAELRGRRVRIPRV